MRQWISNLTNLSQFAIAAGLAFFMAMTRGSHVLTSVSLPDASLAIFLFGGLMLGRSQLGRGLWFAALFILATAIDFGAAQLDPTQGYCLTAGYWGLIPTYACMWVAGVWLSKREQPFKPATYLVAGLISTVSAFIISTQSYYLFSGRFPQDSVWQSLQHGWEYLPSYLGFTCMYLAAGWALHQLFAQLAATTSVHNA